ncbi:MAG TPA: hypothetical protein EYQ74_12135 [Planctomycetes bacterium]|nr:hypothetical protein [Planctomycetota bacterium]
MAKILFPHPGCQVSGTTLTVRGTASDGSAIESVSVNGVEATTLNGFADWQAEVAIGIGSTVLVVSTADNKGNASTAAATSSVDCSGSLWANPMMVDADPATDTLIVSDWMRDTLVEVDPVTGVRSVIVGPATDPDLSMRWVLRAMAMDAASNRMLMVGGDKLIEVDLTTGVRGLLSDWGAVGKGAGPILPYETGLAVSADGTTAYLTDAVLDALVRIDLATGDRTIISDDVTGSGPILGTPVGIYLDEPLTRALIADYALDALFKIDLATGDRTIVSDELLGAGDLTKPRDLAYDPVADRVFLTDYGIGGENSKVVVVDITTGGLTVISDNATGAGDPLYKPRGLVWDASRARILVLNQELASLVSVDPSTGDRSPFSDVGVGEGGGFIGQWGAVRLDAANNRLICGDPGNSLGGSLIEVDLTTGDRSIWMDPSLVSPGDLGTFALSNESGLAYLQEGEAEVISIFDPVAGTLTPFVTGYEPMALIVDDADRSLLVLDYDSLSRVDLATGAITVVSSAAVGTGPDIEGPTGMAVDESFASAWIPNDDGEALLRVDLTSGDRVIVSDNDSIGTGVPFINMGELAVDVDAGLAYMAQHNSLMDVDTTCILVIDLASGDRRAMTLDADSSRSPLGFPRFLARDPATGLIYATDYGMGGSVFVVDPVSECKAILSSGQ